MTHIPLRIDALNCFNNIIEGINRVTEVVKEVALLPEMDAEEAEDFCLPRGLQNVDIEFKILAGYLDKIAARAVELDDPELLRLCGGLGLIQPTAEATEGTHAGN